MVIAFDLDDTICRTDEYSRKYILNFFKKNHLPYKQIAKIARFGEQYFDWNTDTALEWYRNFGDQMMLEFPRRREGYEWFT